MFILSAMLTANDASEILRLATGIQVAGMVERKLAEQAQQQQQLLVQVQFQIQITQASNPAMIEVKGFHNGKPANGALPPG